jgi:SAM-dependent methyltransferase
MEKAMTDGWVESASAWLTDMGDRGDFSREFVLDAPMMARVAARPYVQALDIGCGEGRFCRMLQATGIETIGIDPTEPLLRQARLRDPTGDYRMGRAEALEFADGSFDLVVSYLTLIDIPDVRKAIAEMVRVLQPGGTLLIANLTSFSTARSPERIEGEDGDFVIDHYLEEREEWVSWRGIRIRNWHRPLSLYMSLLLGQGLELRHFDEPSPVGGDPEMVERFRRVPFFLIMEWRKPAA